MKSDCEADGDISNSSKPHFLLFSGHGSGERVRFDPVKQNVNQGKDLAPSFSDRLISLHKRGDSATLPFPAIALARNGYSISFDGSTLECGICPFTIPIFDVSQSPHLLFERHLTTTPNCDNVLSNTLKPHNILLSNNRNDTLRTASSPATGSIGHLATQIQSTSALVSSRSDNELPVPIHVKSVDGRLGNDGLRVRTSDDSNSTTTDGAGPVSRQLSGSVPSVRERATPSVRLQTPKPIVITELVFSPKPMALNPEYDSYECRLASFIDWPMSNPMAPTELARAGFYYTHYRDKTKCPYCNGSVYNWEVTDTGFGEHKRHYPQCEFLKFLTYEILSSHLPPISILSDMEAIGDCAYLHAVEAVRDLGYPQKFIDPVITSCRRENRQISATIILESIFELERKEKRCLLEISEEPTKAPVEADEGAVGGLNLNEQNVSDPNPLLPPVDIGDDLYKAPDSETSDNGPDVTLQLESLPKANEDDDVHVESLPSAAKAEVEITPEIRKIQEEYQRLKKSNICNKCKRQPVNTLFLPCRHLVTCETCAESSDECLQCFEEIIGTVKVFLP